MSWGAAGSGIMSAFKQGMQQDSSPSGIRKMRDANDPSGQGYGGAPGDGRQPAAPLANSLPATVGQTVAPPGVGQPVSLTPSGSDPFAALMHAIWGKR
jgi:hypothetical protein